MKVRITSRLGYSTREQKTCETCGHVGPVAYKLGAVADLPEELAVKLINNGIATAFSEPVIETGAPAARAPVAKHAAKHAAKPKASKSSRPAKEEAE